MKTSTLLIICAAITGSAMADPCAHAPGFNPPEYTPTYKEGSSCIAAYNGMAACSCNGGDVVSCDPWGFRSSLINVPRLSAMERHGMYPSLGTVSPPANTASEPRLLAMELVPFGALDTKASYASGACKVFEQGS